MHDRQARTVQYKLNETSCKTANYCIPAAQLHVRSYQTRFLLKLKGVAWETNVGPLL
jgi:hypothetical protein